MKHWTLIANGKRILHWSAGATHTRNKQHGQRCGLWNVKIDSVFIGAGCAALPATIFGTTREPIIRILLLINYLDSEFPFIAGQWTHATHAHGAAEKNNKIDSPTGKCGSVIDPWHCNPSFLIYSSLNYSKRWNAWANNMPRKVDADYRAPANPSRW